LCVLLPSLGKVGLAPFLEAPISHEHHKMRTLHMPIEDALDCLGMELPLAGLYDEG
jgi:hypothetical protein